MNESDLQTAADRLRKKQCPFCTSTDIAINIFAQKGTCRDCGNSMTRRQAEDLIKRYPPTE